MDKQKILQAAISLLNALEAKFYIQADGQYYTDLTLPQPTQKKAEVQADKTSVRLHPIEPCPARAPLNTSKTRRNIYDHVAKHDYPAKFDAAERGVPMNVEFICATKAEAWALRSSMTKWLGYTYPGVEYATHTANNVLSVWFKKPL